MQHLKGNAKIFYDTYLSYLTEYIENDPDYSYTRQTCADVRSLAYKMLAGFVSGAASKDSAACKALGIKHTYKAIREFIAAPLEELSNGR
jgi:hypothetical protein